MAKRGKPVGCLPKDYRWQIEIFDDDGEIHSILRFKSVKQIMTKFPKLTNKYTIYNLANGKYKLDRVGRIDQDTLDFYNSIRISRIDPEVAEEEKDD